MALKHFQDALRDCRTAILLQGEYQSPKILMRLAKCYIATGEYKAALEIIDTDMGCEPDPSLSLNDILTTQQVATQMRRQIEICRSQCKSQRWEDAAVALKKAAEMCEGGECPAPWCALEVEIDIARRDWTRAAQNAE